MSKKLSIQEKARRMWVRALRSGKYKWGKEQLHPSEEKYCCLGVLCEVAVKQGVISKYKPNSGTLPYEVASWVGLRSCYGDFGHGEVLDGQDTLAGLNDTSKRNPFYRISRLIENKKLGLFVDEISK